MSALTEVALNKANAFGFLVPIFGLAMGVAIYGETLGLSTITGIVVGNCPRCSGHAQRVRARGGC